MAVANLCPPPNCRLGQLQWLCDAQSRFDACGMRAVSGCPSSVRGDDIQGVKNAIVPGYGYDKRHGVQPRRATGAFAEKEEDGAGFALSADRRECQEAGSTGGRESGYRGGGAGRRHDTRGLRRACCGSGRRAGQAAQLQDRNMLCRIRTLPRRGHSDLSHFDTGGQK